MRTGNGIVPFRATDASGRKYDTTIDLRFARIADDGLLLSFTLPDDSRSVWDWQMVLDDRNRKHEERVRRVLDEAIPLGFALSAGKAFRKATDQELKAHPYALYKVSEKLVGWLDSHTPRISKENLAYYRLSDNSLAFNDLLYVT